VGLMRVLVVIRVSLEFLLVIYVQLEEEADLVMTQLAFLGAELEPVVL
jgi:hypothetical protein